MTTQCEISVVDMVESYLKDHGYDGLLNESNECGCKIGDLAPCCSIDESCIAGYKADCDDACGHDEETKCGWHIQLEKPFKV